MAKPPPPVEWMTREALIRGISYYESRTPPLSKGQVARLTELRGELSKRPEEPPEPRQELLTLRDDFPWGDT